MYLFTALNQENLIVTLNNEPKEAHGRLAGNYTLAPNMVNEKKHWLQQGGTNAIWYCKHAMHDGVWGIGPQTYNNKPIIGNCFFGIYAKSDSTGPEKATGWKYSKSGWQEPSNDNDILVELGNTTTLS